MKKRLKFLIRFLFCILLVSVLGNILLPLYCKAPDAAFFQELQKMDFTSETSCKEQIRCIDDNEEALLWRLRMMEQAKEEIILSTFDLRADENGTKILAALDHAAQKGIQIRILVDGIYQKLFLNSSNAFQSLRSYENVEIGIYNPITAANIFKVNYRMHDKYIIIDEQMYLLGGRNTNDIFLGDHTTGINADRDILVYDCSGGEGESLQQLRDYFEEIWKENCVKKLKHTTKTEKTELTESYADLREQYNNLDSYDAWENDTYAVNKITLLSNGTKAGPKAPRILQGLQHLAEGAEEVLIQTPYVICNSYMYTALENMAEHGKFQIVLNAVEKGSNPWGCTDYLNQKNKILETGADVYELMNEIPVHTKTVLIDNRLSVVGSYNLDMRSTYLDTELMLVIDSEILNEQIRETEAQYMTKSKEVLSSGQETEGEQYEKRILTWQKKLFYSVLRIVIRPLRQLL